MPEIGLFEVYYNVRAIESVVPNGVEWRDALMLDMYPKL